jgi:signal peptidase
MRTVPRETVRIGLFLTGPALVTLAAVAAMRGGLWLAALAPAALGLSAHARLVGRWRQAVPNVPLAIGAVCFAAFVVGPLLGAYRTVTVLSGSMRPSFGPGDVIVVAPEPSSSLRVGQVISFATPTAGHPVETHRVVAIRRPGDNPIVETKGDANNTRDPWAAELHGTTLWRYRFRLPYVGYPILFLRTPWVQHISVLLLPALLALWALARIWSPKSRRVNGYELT